MNLRQPNRESHIENRISRIQKVVIDAGHGGKDPGGMGANSQEKHIALRIAQLLSIGIRTNFPDVEVLMTRSDDTFIPLHERAEIANKAGADLFISIHANIMPGSSATRGTETFVMGQHVAQHNLDVAKRENAAILLEGGDVKTNYGFDPNSDEGHILMSMFQHAYLERSIQFAELVEQEFAAAGRKSRGVKQAGFVVLKKTTMPAVLVETGFMSNPTEEAYLLSDAGQRRLANGLLKAFGQYHKLMGGEAIVLNSLPGQRKRIVSSGGQLNQQTPRVQQAANTATPPPNSQLTRLFGKEINLPSSPTPARQQQWTAKGVEDTPLTYQRTPQVYNYVPPVPTTTQAAPPAVATPRPPSQAEQQAALLRRQVKARNAVSNRVVPGAPVRPAAYGTPVTSYSPTTGRPVVVDSLPGQYQFRKAKSKQAPAPPRGIDLRQIPDNQLLYAVQIAATTKAVDRQAPPYRGLPYDLHHFREGGLNKYQVRGQATATQAKATKVRLKELGFFDAMIVVYLQGKRLGAEQVRYLLGR